MSSLDNAGSEYTLTPPPGDGVSAVEFAPSANVVLSACWDSKLRLYDVTPNRLVHAFDTKAACLDCCFVDNRTGVCGGLDRTVRVYDLGEGGAPTTLGSHENGVRCVGYSRERECVLSGGWDGAVHAWDPRSAGSAAARVASMNVTQKVFTMDMIHDKLVVGTAERRIICYDLRNLAQPLWDRESSLKYQTRCIRIFPDGSGFAIASIEGRVAVEYFDAEAEAKKYSFKCHRSAEGRVFPVNSIAFHPHYGTFATGGCDGFVNIWDGQNKKRLSQLPCYQTSVASLSFNHDGSMLAVAASYTFEEGEKDHPPDQVYIRMIADTDVRPKNR